MGFGCFVTVGLLAVDGEEIFLEIFLGDAIAHDGRRSSVIRTWSCSGLFTSFSCFDSFPCFATFYAVDLRKVLPLRSDLL